MILDYNELQQIVGTIPAGSKQEVNARSFLEGLNEFGVQTGLNKPHRLASYIGQVGHESGNFRYDREIWGNTPAQQRYDIRTDLGNTPERDGDGKKYKGRTAMQITGKDNYRQFRDWARKLDPDAPDFVEDPDMANTDPWEGLGPIWYWSTRKLNKWADKNDQREVTRRINGGYNGWSDRLQRTDRAMLVLCGFTINRVKDFQTSCELKADGIIGEQTRNAMFEKLVKMPPIDGASGKPPARSLTPAERGAGATAGAGIAAALAAWWGGALEGACTWPIISFFCGG